MIRCMISRGSSNSRLLKSASRRYNSNTSSTRATIQSFQKPPIARTPRYETFSTHQKGNDDNDVRIQAADGEDAASTLTDWEMYLGSSLENLDLPLSPFLDPQAIDAKIQWHSPKARPSKNPTEFQIQLAKNQYAQMLATPIRQCHATKVFVPSFFLQEFNTMAHPVTQRPWMVPRNLTKKYENLARMTNSGGKGPPEPNEAHVQVEDHDGTLAREHNAGPDCPSMNSHISVGADRTESKAPHLQNTDATFTSGIEITASNPITGPSPTPKPQQLQLGTSSYVMSRQQLIRSFSEENSGYQDHWTQMGSERVRRVASGRQIKEATKWRTDMDTFILELMRRRLCEHLDYITHLKRGYISGSASWEDATLAKRQPGAILWTGPHIAEPDGIVQGGFAEQIRIPEFSTLESGKDKKKVAVFNLRRLLGIEHLTKLREKSSVFQKEIVVVRDKRMTIELRMKLWKLEGYMATYAQNVPRNSIKTPSSIDELKLD